MNYGFENTMANGLYVSIDWLSFTLSDSVSPDDAVSLMGYLSEDFQPLPKGRNGYRSQLKLRHANISIQYDGLDGMGIHVDASGSAIHDLLDHYVSSHLCSTPFGTKAYETADFRYTVLVNLLKDICSNGHITRLDLAIDDFGANYFTMSQLYEVFQNDCFVSKFRKWRYYAAFEKGNHDIGSTIYLGSRTSDIMLRIYDKEKEQNEKRKHSGESPLDSPWVRWEFELKDKRALQTVLCLIEGRSISDVAVGILSNYLRIIERDNIRKDRCCVSSVWTAFLDGIVGLKLYCAPPEKSLEMTKQWLKKQVAPSLAVVVQADGGCSDFLYELIDSGVHRLSNYQHELINRSLGGMS